MPKRSAPVILFVGLALLLAGLAAPAAAGDSISPTSIGETGTPWLSSGTYHMATSGFQLAASAITSGVHSIQSGFLAFLQGSAASTVTNGHTLITEVTPTSGPATLTVPPGSLPEGTAVTFQLPAMVPDSDGSLSGVRGSAVEIVSGSQPLSPDADFVLHQRDDHRPHAPGDRAL